MRHPARFVFAGSLWWIAYVVLIEIVLGTDLPTSIDTALRVTFAIISPHEAVTFAWKASHPNAPVSTVVAGVGWMGWSVIVYFTFLIPALVAAMIERLPALASSLSPLMPPQVWQFVERYSESLSGSMGTMLHDVNDLDEDTRTLLEESRTETLRTVADLVRSWYLDQGEDLNANASFMRVTRGSDYRGDPTAGVLYSNKPVSENEYVLELVGWAYESDQLPNTLLLAIDRTNPSPGAPYAIVHDEPDGIADTRDAKEWRRRHVTDQALVDVMAYFDRVPFRSFMSIPVRDGSGGIVGSLSIQVDQPRKFMSGNAETMQLVALIDPICYFLAWIERRRSDAV